MNPTLTAQLLGQVRLLGQEKGNTGSGIPGEILLLLADGPRTKAEISRVLEIEQSIAYRSLTRFSLYWDRAQGIQIEPKLLLFKHHKVPGKKAWVWSLTQGAVEMVKAHGIPAELYTGV